jgi:hypothetical protein
MKPKLKAVVTPFGTHFWRCEGKGQHTGYGMSPHSAYRDWEIMNGFPVNCWFK